MSSERDIGNHAERSLLDAGAPVISVDAEDANEWKRLWGCESFESRKSERFATFKEWCKAQADDQGHAEWLKNIVVRVVSSATPRSARLSTLGRKHVRSTKIGVVGSRQL